MPQTLLLPRPAKKKNCVCVFVCVDYIINVLGVPAADANEVSGRLYRQYGLTVVGLMAENYGVDLDGWHKHVHGTLDYAKLLPRNEPLKELLDSLTMPKYIFTNADREHADTCLRQIGIQDCFDGIIAFDCIVDRARELTGNAEGAELMGQVFCKPDRRAFEYALGRIGEESAGATMFLDDSAANIKGAKDAGLQTVLVGSESPCEGADFAIEVFTGLRDAAPHLWQ